ncbi:MAG: helix-turn-helix transcriptional regulator [Actinomycetota bacterium]
MPRKRGKWEVLTVEEAFGRVLRDLRVENGLSQEQLGFELESGRTYISELERGQRSPTVKWIFRVAHRFGTPPSELMHRVEKLAPGLLARSDH